MRKNATNPEVADNQFMVIASTLHCGFKRATAEIFVGERFMGDAWFDYLLKGEDNGVLQETPKVQYYTMGLNR